MKSSLFVSALASALLLSPVARADLQTYDLSYSTVTGDYVTGTITIDTSENYSRSNLVGSPPHAVYSFAIVPNLTYGGPEFTGIGTPTITGYEQDSLSQNGGIYLDVFTNNVSVDLGILTTGGFTNAAQIGVGTPSTVMDVTYGETNFEMTGSMTLVSDIPEPASLGLFATAAALLPILRRRRSPQG